MSNAVHPITAVEVAKIAAIASRLQSDADGEVINAGRLLVRSLARHGLQIGEVVERALMPQPIPEVSWGPRPATPPRAHHVLVHECLAGKLNTWEAGFVRDLLGKRSLSLRQADVLGDIVNKVRHQRSEGGAA